MAVHPLHNSEDYTKWIDIILNLALLLPTLSFALLQCGPKKPREREKVAPTAMVVRSAEAIPDDQLVGADKSSVSKQSKKEDEEKLPSYLKSTRAKPDPATAHTPKTEKGKERRKREKTEMTQNESAKTDYTTPPWLRWKKLSTRPQTAADIDYFRPVSPALMTSVPAATARNASPSLSKSREPSTRTVLPAPTAWERTARLEVDVERTQMLPPTTAMEYYGGGSRYCVGKTKSTEDCSSTMASRCCQSTVPSVSPHSCASAAKDSSKARVKSTKRRPSSSSSERSNTTSKQKR